MRRSSSKIQPSIPFLFKKSLISEIRISFLFRHPYIIKTFLADGNATKIIVPSNLQELAGLVTSIKEIATDKVDE